MLAPHRAGAVHSEVARLRSGSGGVVLQIALIDELGTQLAQVTQTRVAEQGLNVAPPDVAPLAPEPRLVQAPNGVTSTAEARRRRILDAASGSSPHGALPMRRPRRSLPRPGCTCRRCTNMSAARTSYCC